MKLTLLNVEKLSYYLSVLPSADWKMTLCLVNKLTLFSCKKLNWKGSMKYYEEKEMLFIKYFYTRTCLGKTHKSRLLKTFGLSVLKPCMETCHIKTILLPRVLQTKTVN